jgi:hypothetical protein
MNYAPSVTVALTFLDEWHKQLPQWLAKDIVVLFYDDASQQEGNLGEDVGTNYSESVSEFLKWYYIGHDQLHNQEDVRNLLDGNLQIHGRCGYLR